MYEVLHSSRGDWGGKKLVGSGSDIVTTFLYYDSNTTDGPDHRLTNIPKNPEKPGTSDSSDIYSGAFTACLARSVLQRYADAYSGPNPTRLLDQQTPDDSPRVSAPMTIR